MPRLYQIVTARNKEVIFLIRVDEPTIGLHVFIAGVIGQQPPV